jgi:serine/threonine protein kinase
VSADSRLQLFDWGEAVALSEARAMADKELSRRVGVAGTPLFMPPESLNHLTRRASDDGGGGGPDDDGGGVPRLRGTLSPALDIWGLGTVVFHLLAGRDLVPDSDWELEELADIVNGSGAARLPEGVPASFAARDFLARCLERCPGRRATAAELLSHPWLRGAASAAEVEAARAADAAALRRSASGTLRRAGSSGALRRSASGRLSRSASGAKLAGGDAGAVPIVEGAAVCEITVRMKPSASRGSLSGEARR